MFFINGFIMAAPYSLDLRKKIVSAYNNGEGGIIQLAKTFGIGSATLTLYLRSYREKGTVEAKKPGGGRPLSIKEEGLNLIKLEVKGKPDITIKEICLIYKAKMGIEVSPSMACRALKKLNLIRKKKSLYAAEQERDDVKKNC